METERRAARAAENRPAYAFLSTQNRVQNWSEQLTKISIASLSAFHLSVVFLSSSSDLSKDMENKASEVSICSCRSTKFTCCCGRSGRGGCGGYAARLYEDDGIYID